MLVPVPGKCDTPPDGGPRRVLLCGATGSIGRSTLEVIGNHPGKFELVGITANSNAGELERIASLHRPKYVGLSDHRAAASLQGREKQAFELVVGEAETAELAGLPEVDVVVAAVVGVAGLRSVETAVHAGKTIALANKESLVAAGELVQGAQSRSGAKILPVDSEHSAIFQALQGVQATDLDSLVLTASGGPFLDRNRRELSGVTPEEAVRHPRWSMGAKISVDSATMMNKALELIEAHWLFGVEESRIEVLVHPQSIVHSLVRLCDGGMLAQLSVPDMRGPIAYAMQYPHGRLGEVMPRLNLEEVGQLSFRKLDQGRFPALRLAREALAAGGLAGAVLNLANEAAVQAFLKRRIAFDGIEPFVEQALSDNSRAPATSFAELYTALEELWELFSRDLGLGIL